MESLSNAMLKMNEGAIAQGTLKHKDYVSLGFSAIEFNFPQDIFEVHPYEFLIAEFSSGESNIKQFVFCAAQTQISKTMVCLKSENISSYKDAQIKFVGTTFFQFKDDPEIYTFTDGAVYNIYAATK